MALFIPLSESLIGQKSIECNFSVLDTSASITIYDNCIRYAENQFTLGHRGGLVDYDQGTSLLSSVDAFVLSGAYLPDEDILIASIFNKQETFALISLLKGDQFENHRILLSSKTPISIYKHEEYIIATSVDNDSTEIFLFEDIDTPVKPIMKVYGFINDLSCVDLAEVYFIANNNLYILDLVAEKKDLIEKFEHDIFGVAIRNSSIYLSINGGILKYRLDKDDSTFYRLPYKGKICDVGSGYIIIDYIKKALVKIR